ncbi:MAG: hypothetical protein MUF84_08125 [Anaerolineae bacterium]|jgi:hypothetical protein|nr:hypothetical protein [Anaerolineae bacterium]
MKGELAFNVPFSGFTTTDFINCFASTTMFIEGITGNDDYYCRQRNGELCNGCGNCRASTAGLQEQRFFVFDTMCGRSSLRLRFDGEPTAMQTWIGETEADSCGTDATVDFLFGFAGYAYDKLSDPDAFRAAITASIDAGRPVIAKVKTGEGRFRVLTGYDGELLISPDYTNAQRKPEGAPSYDELGMLILFGDKVRPRYTFGDGLRRIRQVMEYNIGEKLWDGYIGKIGWYQPDGLGKTDLAEKQVRMKRVADTMWYTFNSHNFAEVFRHRTIEALQNPAFDDLCQQIGAPIYGYTHDLAWALIGLNDRLDWSPYHNEYACGWAEMVELTLGRIKQNDIQALDTVMRALEICG